MRVQSLGQEDALEKEMATHSSILAWEISWTEVPGKLQSMVSKKIRHDTVTEQQINKFRKSISQIPTSIHNKNS